MEEAQEIKICINCLEKIVIINKYKSIIYENHHICFNCFKKHWEPKSKVMEIFYEMKDFYKKHKYIGSNKDLKIRFDIIYKEAYVKDYEDAYKEDIKRFKSPRTRKQIVARKYYIKSKILKRDKYQCVFCLIREKLRIHHIIPISIDKTKETNEKNLVTLCQDCHLKAHKYYWKDLDYNIMEKLANYTHAKY